MDSEDDPQILELAALLGVSASLLLNKRKLREKLRRIASRLSREKQAQLSVLLGRWVQSPEGILTDRWVDQQVEAISKSVDTWVARTSVDVSAGVAAETLIGSGAVAAAQARNGAAFAVLALNTALLSQVSSSNGVGDYLWVTKDDAVVRINHAQLHYTIQQCGTPPSGGGTKPGESGHPASGYGCRCEAKPTLDPVLLK